jgi:hypothetical protein
MNSHLYFKMAYVVKLIDHAQKSTERRGSVDECHYIMYNDISEVPPGLLWGKDTGIYLLTNGKLREGQTYHSEQLITYALGYNPATNPNCYDMARQAVGGDDFVEFIPIDKIREAAGDKATGFLHIEVSETHYGVGWVRNIF